MSEQTPYSDATWKDPQQKPFIELQGLCKSFGDFVAVDGIDLSIYKGELFTILGGSGCGKSTFMRRVTSTFGGEQCGPLGGGHGAEGGWETNTLVSDMATVICLDDYYLNDREGRKVSGLTALNTAEQKFDLMFEHTKRYVNAYYESDEDLQDDRSVSAWLSDLDSLIPNGLNGALSSGLTRDGLARVIAAYIYEGNTIHDLTGTSLWDYQLWVDRNPVRIYKDGRRLPVDVYQRLIVNNFALQIKRAPMLADYGQVALDDQGAALFAQFCQECQSLQDRYDQTAAGPWRMEPKNLEISMNG